MINRVTKKINLIKNCHKGNILVFDWNDIDFYGGGIYRDCDIDDCDLVIGLGVQVSDLFTTQTNIPKKYLPKFLQKKRFFLEIEWRDFSVPKMKRKDWEDLLNMILRMKKDFGITKVLFCCAGGHGRTGTALSILAYLCGIERNNPIKFIRKIYCKEAIETYSQIDYINEICGIFLDEKPSKEKDFDFSLKNYYSRYHIYDEYDF